MTMQIRRSWRVDQPPIESANLISLSYLFIEAPDDPDKWTQPFPDGLEALTELNADA